MVDTNTGVITTLKVGTTTITATLKGVTNILDSTTTYLVIISSATSFISVDTATATYVASGTFTANISSVTPTNAITELGGTITYAILSGNGNSVIVDTNTGVITTLKVGTTTITATLKGVD